MPMHSFVVLENIAPPVEAWDGGYIFVIGTVRFEPNPLPYHPGNNVIAFITVDGFSVLHDSFFNDFGENESGFEIDFNQIRQDDCDTCKFAIMISGGVNFRNNHPRYWQSLAALYAHKVANENYCEHNIFCALLSW